MLKTPHYCWGNVKLLEGSVFFANSLKCWETEIAKTDRWQRTRKEHGECMGNIPGFEKNVTLWVF